MTSLFFNQTKQLTQSAIGVTSGICMTNSNPWSSFVTPLTLVTRRDYPKLTGNTDYGTPVLCREVKTP